MTMPDPDSLRDSLEEEKKEKVYLNKIYAFNLDVEGENERRWQGRFIYEVPNIGEKIQIGQMKATYLPQGALADLNASALTEMVCYLSVTLKEKPAWFKPMELMDEKPLVAVYEEVLGYEQKFHGSGTLEQTNGEGSKSSQGSGEADTTDVGRKIQPPTKRSETIISHD